MEQKRKYFYLRRDWRCVENTLNSMATQGWQLSRCRGGSAWFTRSREGAKVPLVYRAKPVSSSLDNSMRTDGGWILHATRILGFEIWYKITPDKNAQCPDNYTQRKAAQGENSYSILAALSAMAVLMIALSQATTNIRYMGAAKPLVLPTTVFLCCLTFIMLTAAVIQSVYHYREKPVAPWLSTVSGFIRGLALPLFLLWLIFCLISF